MFNTIKSIIKKALIVARDAVAWVWSKKVIKAGVILVSGFGASGIAGSLVKGFSATQKANIAIQASVWLAGVVLVWSFTQFVEKLTEVAFDTQLEQAINVLTLVINLL